MRHIFLLLSLALSPLLRAQEPLRQLLWDEKSMSEAELFIYLPAPSSEPSSAVLICPGGGYTGLAINHEGHDMARWYASLGMAAVVLKYRMPHGVHAVPLADAEQAMSVIRSRAAQWNLNPRKVGVVGSSAGGHLAASLSTLAAEANRPDFAILYYPVITFSEGTTHGGSRRNLLGDEQNNRELLERYSLEKQVDAHTPPTLLLLSDDDRTVPPRNSILYYSALQQQGIPASMHIFPTGDHGWGFRTSYLYHDDVKNLIQKWLKKEVDR